MVTKITRLSLLALLALTYVSCSENLLDGGQTASSSRGRSAMVHLNVSTAPEQEANGTRVIDPNKTEEGTGPDYKVSDLWLLEYGTDGKLMKDGKGDYVAKYTTMDQLTANGGKLGIQLPRAGSADKYKCVMIANTHDNGLFSSGNLSDYETLDNIKKSSKNIKEFTDTYNTTNVGGKKSELYLSCVEEVDANTTSLDCRFYRNVAKLTLKLENADKSGMRITNVQLCNVPNRLSYADRLYEGGGANDKLALGASLMDFKKEDVVLDANESKDFVYYLPRNCQGLDVSIKDAMKKNNSGLALTSTCVKIFATDTKTGNPYCYTFYVGENVTNDFSVKPNYHYTLPVEISGHGNKNDSRVEDIASMGANCIMMNLNDKDSVYTIYPYKRINKFWNEVGKDPTRVIDENYEWEAVVVWQDIDADVIEFVGAKTNTFEGKGMHPLKIKLKSSVSEPCNVLIGVKKKGVDPVKFGYLWSWHLWITPYKPDRMKPWENGKYEYTEEVVDGKVYRYIPGVDGSTYNDLWTPDGKYHDKYIMDRNLGATTKTTPTSNDDIKKSSGLHYQFGRKDPFVLYQEIYKSVNTKTQINIGQARAVNISESVKWPNQYFVVTHSRVAKWDWLHPNPYVDNLWNNPFPGEKEYEDKSFFDPCPEGWRLPLLGTWNCFSYDRVIGRDQYSIRRAVFKNGSNFYVGNAGGVTTFYPAAGFNDSDGKLSTGTSALGIAGSYWSASPYNSGGVNYSYSMFFRHNYVLPQIDTNRVWACSVRCVQE